MARTVCVRHARLYFYLSAQMPELCPRSESLAFDPLHMFRQRWGKTNPKIGACQQLTRSINTGWVGDRLSLGLWKVTLL